MDLKSHARGCRELTVALVVFSIFLATLSLQAGTAELNAAHSTILDELKWEDAKGCASYDDFWAWYEGVMLGLGQPALADIQDVCGGVSVAYGGSSDKEIKNDPTAACVDKIGVLTADSGKTAAFRDFYLLKKTGLMIERSALSSEGIPSGSTFGNTVEKSWDDVTRDAKLIQICDSPSTVSGIATLSGVTAAVAAEDSFKTAFKAALATQYSVVLPPSATTITIGAITETTSRRQRRLASLSIAYTIQASSQIYTKNLIATAINTTTLATDTKASYTGTASALSFMSVTAVANLTSGADGGAAAADADDGAAGDEQRRHLAAGVFPGGPADYCSHCVVGDGVDSANSLGWTGVRFELPAPQTINMHTGQASTQYENVGYVAYTSATAFDMAGHNDKYMANANEPCLLRPCFLLQDGEDAAAITNVDGKSVVKNPDVEWNLEAGTCRSTTIAAGLDMRKYCNAMTQGTNAQIMSYVAMEVGAPTVREAIPGCAALWYLTDQDSYEAGAVLQNMFFANQPYFKVGNAYGDYVSVGSPFEPYWWSDWVSHISPMRFTGLIDEQTRKVTTYFISYNTEVGARVYTAAQFEFSRATNGDFKVAEKIKSFRIPQYLYGIDGHEITVAADKSRSTKTVSYPMEVGNLFAMEVRLLINCVASHYYPGNMCSLFVQRRSSPWLSSRC
jgi:hypothetical protein